MKITKFTKRLISVLLLSITFMIAAPDIIQNSSMQTVEAATIKLSSSSKILLKGKSAVITIKNTSNNVKWYSSKNSVVSIKKISKYKIKITAKKYGTATVTAKIGNKKYNCKVKVENPKISKSSIAVYTGKYYTLKITKAYNKVKWTSSNKDVATVKNGKVHAKCAGTAKITAKVGNKKLTCIITVKSALNASGSRANPSSAYSSFTSDIYEYGEYSGNFTIQLVDYKSGIEAYEYVAGDYYTEPESNEEYIYLKFNIKYNSGNDITWADNIVNCYSNIFDSSSNMRITKKGWALKSDELDMVDAVMYPGTVVTCSKSILIEKGNAPVVYRLETGYDSQNNVFKYTWFTTEK